MLRATVIVPSDAGQDRHEAQRPVREAGGGQTEGFEEAVELLKEHASHGDSQAAHAILHDQAPPEPDPGERQDGEADHERTSEDDVDDQPDEM